VTVWRRYTLEWRDGWAVVTLRDPPPRYAGPPAPLPQPHPRWAELATMPAPPAPAERPARGRR